MAPKILIVTLNPALDRTVIAGNEIVSAGGKGINVSRALKSLEFPSLNTGFLGGNTGNMIRRLMKRERLITQFVTVKEKTRENISVIDPKKGKMARVIQKGPRVTAKDLERFKRKYYSLLKGKPLVMLCGRNGSNMPDGFYAALVRQARERACPVMLDTSGKPLALAIRALPEVLKVNREEIETALKVKLSSRVKINQMIKKLHGIGIKIVLITLGAEGSVGSDGSRSYHVKAPPLKEINQVGCGDAFAAGFAAAYLRNKSFKDSLKCAVAAGAASALEPVPGLVNKRKYGVFLKKLRA